jgi:hypothetical protein
LDPLIKSQLLSCSAARGWQVSKNAGIYLSSLLPAHFLLFRTTSRALIVTCVTRFGERANAAQEQIARLRRAAAPGGAMQQNLIEGINEVSTPAPSWDGSKHPN